MPLELWRERYDPFCVDGVKWASEFDSDYLQRHKKIFFEAWLSTLPSNRKIYLDAWLLATYDFWAPGSWLGVQSEFACAFTHEVLNIPDPNGNINDRFELGDLELLNLELRQSIGNFMIENVFAFALTMPLLLFDTNIGRAKAM